MQSSFVKSLRSVTANGVPEAFMEEVEKDANRRYKDKQVRREKAATFKKLANLAFHRGEYEKALTNYDKVKKCAPKTTF